MPRKNSKAKAPGKKPAAKPAPKKTTTTNTPKTKPKTTKSRIIKPKSSQPKRVNPHLPEVITNPELYHEAAAVKPARDYTLAPIPEGDKKWDVIRAAYAGPYYDRNQPIQQLEDESDAEFMQRLWIEGQGLSSYKASLRGIGR